MELVDKLRNFAAIEGFVGVGIFNSGRECMAVLADSPQLIKQVGILANQAANAMEKACVEASAGAIDMVHIEAEKANILIKCHNENTDPCKPEPGKAHIHIVMLLSSLANVGLAKLRMSAIINELGADFWTWCRIKQYAVK